MYLKPISHNAYFFAGLLARFSGIFKELEFSIIISNMHKLVKYIMI